MTAREIMRAQRRTERWHRKHRLRRTCAMQNAWRGIEAAERRLHISFDFNQEPSSAKAVVMYWDEILGAVKVLMQDMENPACYCLYCNWAGHEDDLFEDIVRGFSVCPQCYDEAIVFTE